MCSTPHWSTGLHAMLGLHSRVQRFRSQGRTSIKFTNISRVQEIPPDSTMVALQNFGDPFGDPLSEAGPCSQAGSPQAPLNFVMQACFFYNPGPWTLVGLFVVGPLVGLLLDPHFWWCMDGVLTESASLGTVTMSPCLARTHARTHACTQAHRHARTPARTPAHMHSGMHVRTCVLAHTRPLSHTVMLVMRTRTRTH